MTGGSRRAEDACDDVCGRVARAGLRHEATQAGEIVARRDQAGLDAPAPDLAEADVGHERVADTPPADGIGETIHINGGLYMD